MKKLKILVCIEAVLGIVTLVSIFVTRDSTDFSGFLVGYLIISMILVAIPILAILLIEIIKSKNKKIKVGIWLIIIIAAAYLFLGYML